MWSVNWSIWLKCVWNWKTELQTTPISPQLRVIKHWYMDIINVLRLYIRLLRLKIRQVDLTSKAILFVLFFFFSIFLVQSSMSSYLRQCASKFGTSSSWLSSIRKYFSGISSALFSRLGTTRFFFFFLFPRLKSMFSKDIDLRISLTQLVMRQQIIGTTLEEVQKKFGKVAGTLKSLYWSRRSLLRKRFV